MIIADTPRQTLPRNALFGAVILLAIQLLVIGLVYKHGIDFNCLANWSRNTCASASYMLVSVYGVIGAFVLFGLLSRGALRGFFDSAGRSLWPLAMNVVGLVIAMIPVLFLSNGTGTSAMIPSFLCWGIGMSLLGCGLLLFLAPAARWFAFLSEHGARLIPLLIGGAVAPYLAILIRPLWRLEAIAGATFEAVVYLIKLFGYDVWADGEIKIIGADNFFINVAPVCSGIEGIALVTIFVTLYLWLFKDQLNFPRVLLLYPIGIITSGLLNVVRITVLLAIGLNGNEELAVGGFHSHAGWMMFTAIAIGIVAIANSVRWFQKETHLEAVKSSATVPFFKDPMIARLLPFAVFMITAIFAQAFSETPSIVYPARAAVVALTLALFWPFLRTLPWRSAPVAVAIGAVIGIAWIIIPVADPETTPPYGALSGITLVLWMAARGIGTTILVPILEELFFRDYLEGKLRKHDTLAWTIGAAVIGAALFAALHGRWVEAFFAALLFSYAARRAGNITDAIVAHAVANGLIFAVAVSTQQMHII